MSSITDKYKEFDDKNEKMETENKHLQELKEKARSLECYNDYVRIINEIRIKMMKSIEGPKIFKHSYVMNGGTKVVCWEIKFIQFISNERFGPTGPSTFELLIESGDLITATTSTSGYFEGKSINIPDKILSKINVQEINDSSKIKFGEKYDEGSVNTHEINHNGIILSFGDMQGLCYGMINKGESIFGITDKYSMKYMK